MVAEPLVHHAGLVELPLPQPGAVAGRAVREWLERSGAPLAARVRTLGEQAAARAAAAHAPAAWSAALPAVAALFPAGLPRGELVGRRSAGRFGFCLAILAAATQVGENAALVDLGDALDPQSAAAAGVELPRLLWARPHDGREALAAAEALVGGGLPLVVVDLGLPPVPGGRGAEGQWLRLARAAHDAGALLLVSAPYRATGVGAGVALELQSPGGRWLGAGREPRLLAGIDARLAAVKPHLAPAAAAPGALRLVAS